MTWQSMKTAPRDGTKIWLATKDMQLEMLGRFGQSSKHIFVNLVRFDSWNFVYKLVQSGEVQDLPLRRPVAWHPVNMPAKPDAALLEQFENEDKIT